MKSFIYILFLLVSVSVYGATVSTPIFGTYKVECPADSDTYMGVSVTRMPEFTGTVQSVSVDSFRVVANGEPNWQENKFVFSDTQKEHYYLKFTSGALEGAWYDINSNDGYSVRINIGASELAKVAEGDSFQIIPHWTMSTLFPDGGGFIKSITGSTSGVSLVYKYTKFTEDGLLCPIGINRAMAYSYFYIQRGAINSWRNGTNISEDSSSEVIEPNSVIKVSQPERSSTITFNGVVPECATSFEVFTALGEDGAVQSQDIYVATPSAVDIKMSDLTECLVDSGAFTAGTRTGEDFVYIYRNERIGKNLTQDDTCWFMKRGDIARWLDGNQGDGGECLLKASGIMVIRKVPTNEPMAMRCTFRPPYLENLESK